ncbi:thiamine biosynthesis protein ThiS [Roseateles aquatilis]|uniref:Thiamine biosynthesis protein ThiS n=1 Tax=Roseateles aquatilis TaxID=431061 RepID=A0A246J4X9_9BURK|nr:MoaD/ThiS family protein [Roseateles aquatilis]OWQ87633.1 thiamine biosynthesis protein ThiS [Roseateles aquatilis]
MAHVEFTAQLHRFVDTPKLDCDARTLGEALTVAFDRNPRLRGYILDDQGHLRTHVTVFIDGHRVQDRQGLADPLSAQSKVYVLQALSGG